MPNDADEFEQVREDLVEHLIASGRLARGSATAEAFRDVPRHVFVPDVTPAEAYRDTAIPTKRDDRGRAVSSSSQPAIMATMLDQLDLHPGQRVLEIGTGTGYNAALIAHLVGPRGEVVTVDIDPDLVTAARAHLTTADITVTDGADTSADDGANDSADDGADDGTPREVGLGLGAETTPGPGAGSPAHGAATVSVLHTDGALPLRGEPGRFDRVVVTAGARDIAPTWLEQLAPDGRMVVPLSLRGAQRCLTLEPTTYGWTSVSVHDCGFMALQGAMAGPEALTELREGSGVFLHRDRALPTTPETVLGWTSRPTGEHATTVEVDHADAIARFGLWLALTDPDTIRLFTTSGAADHDNDLDDDLDDDLARTLLPSPGGPAAVALLTDQGLATLSFPTAAATPTARGFGPDGLLLARRLLDHLQTWQSAGRPSSEHLHLEGHPPDAGPADHLSTINNPHSRITAHWTSTPEKPPTEPKLS